MQHCRIICSAVLAMTLKRHSIKLPLLTLYRNEPPELGINSSGSVLDNQEYLSIPNY